MVSWGKYKCVWIHKRHPLWRLIGELWGVNCEIFGENWPHYNGTALYNAVSSQPTCICGSRQLSHGATLSKIPASYTSVLNNRHNTPKLRSNSSTPGSTAADVLPTSAGEDKCTLEQPHCLPPCLPLSVQILVECFLFVFNFCTLSLAPEVPELVSSSEFFPLLLISLNLYSSIACFNSASTSLDTCLWVHSANMHATLMRLKMRSVSLAVKSLLLTGMALEGLDVPWVSSPHALTILGRGWPCSVTSGGNRGSMPVVACRRRLYVCSKSRTHSAPPSTNRRHTWGLASPLRPLKKYNKNTDGLVQGCGISSASAMEIP